MERLSPGVPDLLATHRALLERWRHAMNLVGPGDVEEHYRDADQALAGLAPAGRWVDLGTGAGFPGIVFAARFPDVQLDLVDSRKKRCAFLEHVLAEAGVAPDRVRVRCVRAEALEGPYDGVLARAFGPPADVLEHAARLLAPGGLVVLFLGRDAVVPEDDRFAPFHVERYRLDDRERQAVTLRRR